MTSRLVLDASAAIGAVRLAPPSAEILRFCGEATIVMAPGLFAAEVASGLWRYVAGDTLARDAAVEPLGEALGIVDVLVPDRELAEEALVAAAVHRHTVYDLRYAVLARRHGAAVLTLDNRFRALLARMDVEALPDRRVVPDQTLSALRLSRPLVLTREARTARRRPRRSARPSGRG